MSELAEMQYHFFEMATDANSYCRFMVFGAGQSMLRIAFGAILCSCLTASLLSANAQAPNATKQSSPKSPQDLVRAGAKVNGLAIDAIGPWHLRATFTLFDAMGNQIDHGSYTKLRINRKEGKGEIESTGFSESWIVHGGKALTISGTTAPWPDLLQMMSSGFVSPIYEEDGFSLRFVPGNPDAEDPSMRCVSATLRDAGGVLNTAMSKSVLCFDPIQPVLLARIDSLGIKVARQNIFSFQGSYVARDLTISRNRRVYLKAHLESLEEASSIDQAGVVLPIRASEQPSFSLYKSTAEAMRIQTRRVDPEYPADALAARVSGVVNVKTTIDVDGRVLYVLALDGPPMLEKAALETVRQYRFTPVTLNDNTKCRIETVFPVEFKLPISQ